MSPLGSALAMNPYSFDIFENEINANTGRCQTSFYK